jgi:hypothetical protein
LERDCDSIGPRGKRRNNVALKSARTRARQSRGAAPASRSIAPGVILRNALSAHLACGIRGRSSNFIAANRQKRRQSQ